METHKKMMRDSFYLYCKWAKVSPDWKKFLSIYNAYDRINKMTDSVLNVSNVKIAKSFRKAKKEEVK